ncbi:MAG: hypothetical protein OHK0039_43820 [Bacteroidia bacterium]
MLAQACKAPRTPVALAADSETLRAAVTDADKPYVLVSFYTTYCKPCVKEFPDLLQMQHDANSPVSVLFVSLDEPHIAAEQLSGFMQAHRLDVNTYHFDPTQAAAFIHEEVPTWDQSVPLNLLYTREGRLVESLGMTSAKEVTMLVHQDQSFQ